jgi:hypothetical protein
VVVVVGVLTVVVVAAQWKAAKVVGLYQTL